MVLFSDKYCIFQIQLISSCFDIPYFTFACGVYNLIRYKKQTVTLTASKHFHIKFNRLNKTLIFILHETGDDKNFAMLWCAY